MNQNKFDQALYLFNHGEYYDSYQTFGSHPVEGEGNNRFRFTVWAPNAQSVSVIGDFTDWDEGMPLERYGETGVWTGKLDHVYEGQCYKYRVMQEDGTVVNKIDPYGFEFEVRPKDATVIKRLPQKEWNDQDWLSKRKEQPIYNQPLNIYEVHLSSWRQEDNGDWYSFKRLGDELISYVKEMGYTHIELMPLMEHPLDASWGYQITGYFAVSSKYGSIEDFQNFVEKCHQNGIGVILDWVPGHYNSNENALGYFDGTPTFESVDPNRAINHSWGTYNFDFGKEQVQSFLISNALFWIELFHLDGLRVDAVSNVLYLDFDEGEWTPNEEGTNINKEGVAFFKKLNKEIFLRQSNLIMAAEESTDYPKVTAPVEEGGLGFNYKWNMGWMGDTSRFFEMDPEYRKNNFDLITFSFMYAMNENYILPYSHDEVVHGKKSLLQKMFGDHYNQLANLRTLEIYRMTFPGKKLTFMGNEFAQFLEWRFDEQLTWENLEDETHRKHQHFIKTLNHLYEEKPSLWEYDHEPQGIHVQKADDGEQTVLIFRRHESEENRFLTIALNFRPHEYTTFDIGVPYEGTYQVILNTEMHEFGGKWEYEETIKETSEKGIQNEPYSIQVTLPAMGALIIEPRDIVMPKEENNDE